MPSIVVYRDCGYAWIPLALLLSNGAVDLLSCTRNLAKSADCGARSLNSTPVEIAVQPMPVHTPDDVDNPQYLWAEAGSVFEPCRDNYPDLTPLDLLLEEPISGQ